MTYTKRGEDQVILIYPSLVTDEVHAFAQRLADQTGKTIEVFAPNGVDILDQVRPTPPAAPPQTPFGSIAAWVQRNLQDPDE